MTTTTITTRPLPRHRRGGRVLTALAAPAALVALLASPAAAQADAPRTDGTDVVSVSRDSDDRYVCVGTVQQGRYCVVVWFPGQP